MRQEFAPTDRRKEQDTLMSPWLSRLPWVAAAATAFLLLGGCSDLVLFTPKGPIGEAERFIILMSFLLMLIVVLPVIGMALWFAWRYRISSRLDHQYDPRWSYSLGIELAIWLIPVIIVTALATLIWNSTSRLDPFAPIASAEKPVNIEVVSLDWKWLFIYPDENVAVVNHLVFPANGPVAFRLTSGSVMTSFFIPQLGSQIYAMAGMQTRLHLLAHTPGTYFGHNQQFSGSGYAHMNFKAVAASKDEYAAWLDKARQASETLDMNRYQELAQPSLGFPVTYFSSVDPELFDRIVGQFTPPGSHHWPQGPKKHPEGRDPAEDRSQAMGPRDTRQP